MNKKHYVIHFDDKDKIIVTTPKDWARNNKIYFEKYTFENSKSTPTSENIERTLIGKFGYIKISNNDKVICFKLL